MTRLIDAERLKAGIFNACIDEHFKATRLLNWDNITDIINNAPTATPKLSDEQIDKITDLLEIEWGYEGIREDVSRILREA